MAGKLKINVISESAFTVQGHGVQTAFVEMTNILRRQSGFDVRTNSFRRADIIHVHTVGLYSLLAMVAGRGKRVISAHVIPDSFVGSLAGARYWYPLAKLWLRWFYSRGDAVLAVSESVANGLRKQLKLRTPIYVMYNTIDSSQFKSSLQAKLLARRRLRIKPELPVVVSAGQIQPRKHFDWFVAMAQQLPDWLFVWVGGMPFKRLAADYAHMQRLIKTAPPNVVATGVVSSALVKRYYRAADVFVLPSEQETFGIVIIEAAAAGLPVITRPLKVFTKPFGNHILKARSAREFVRLLERLLSSRSFYKARQSQSAKLAKAFDSRTTLAQLRQIYQELGV